MGITRASFYSFGFTLHHISVTRVPQATIASCSNFVSPWVCVVDGQRSHEHSDLSLGHLSRVPCER
jgi:hypothetical protein